MAADVGGWPCSPLQLVVLAAMCLQNTTYTLLRRYSLTTGEKYNAQVVLLVGEMLKLTFSALMAVRLADPVPVTAGSATKPVAASGGFAKLRWLATNSGHMAMLACIYASMNMLSFVALRRIDATTFTVCAQLKTLTTAVCSVVFLGRTISATKWRALVLMVLACILVTVPQLSHNASSSKSTVGEQGGGSLEHLIGITAVLLEVTLSGFATVYFEKHVKNSAEGLCVFANL